MLSRVVSRVRTSTRSVAVRRSFNTVSAKQAVDAIKASQGVVVDIRSKSESGISKVPGAVNVARDAIAENASKLSKSSPLYLLDTSGYFSQQSAPVFEQNGFNVNVIEGGLVAWIDQGGALEFSTPALQNRLKWLRENATSPSEAVVKQIVAEKGLEGKIKVPPMLKYENGETIELPFDTSAMLKDLKD